MQERAGPGSVRGARLGRLAPSPGDDLPGPSLPGPAAAPVGGKHHRRSPYPKCANCCAWCSPAAASMPRASSPSSSGPSSTTTQRTAPIARAPSGGSIPPECCHVVILGLFAEVAKGQFALTPLGDHLRTGAPSALRDLAIF